MSIIYLITVQGSNFKTFALSMDEAQTLVNKLEREDARRGLTTQCTIEEIEAGTI